VLSVSRRPYGASFPKLRECIVPDFMKVEDVAQQTDRIRCLLLLCRREQCGKSKAEYTLITYDTTLPLCGDCGEGESWDGVHLCVGDGDGQHRKGAHDVGAG